MSPSKRRRDKVPLLAYRLLPILAPIIFLGVSEQVCQDVNDETPVANMHLAKDDHQALQV
jgi:hypothetical protein